MNFSTVAPPSQPGQSSDQKSAFADALARAQQIAAKINQPGSTPDGGNPLKRSYEGDNGSQPDLKKPATADSIGVQLRAIADQTSTRASQAAQAAAAAASQINAKLGITNSGGPPPIVPQLGMSQPHMGGPHAGLGMVTTDDYAVPDRMVGLIIGKGGEQIATIQAETGCKVQFAQDSNGMPDRPCTLTGTAEAICKAKDTIQRIISKGQGLPDGQGEGSAMLEVMVPGNKVGLVIGKGGETIKNLQEQAMVKMVMIQESNLPTNHEKPLRITGSMGNCQRAKEMILDIIADKDGQGGGGFNDYGRGSTEMPVPRPLVGVVIGRGGEMIKKIQNDTGAKVQFKPDDGVGDFRVCCVTGSPDKVQQASVMINELIDQASTNDRNRGRGRGGGMNNSFGGGPGGGNRDGFGGFGGQDEAPFTVPADKCGLVIGKGGETIRELNRISGAHVELNRNQSGNPRERVFKIRGNHEQIQHAMRLIAEKAGMGGGNDGGNGPMGGGPPGGYGDPNYPNMGGGGPAPAPQQQYQQQGGGPGPQQQGFAPQGWGNGGYQQWNQGNAGAPDPCKQGADQNAHAWQEYYQQFYNGNQQQQPQQQPASTATPQAAGPTSQASAAVNPQTGQPDYSQQWAEYYQRQGMHYHAAAILQQSAAQNQPGSAAPATQ